MKKIILSSLISFAVLYTIPAAAQNFASFKKDLSGRKIVSVTEQTSGPSGAGNGVQAPVSTSGGARITVGNAGQSTNYVSKTLNFKKEDAGTAKGICSFNRIRTSAKNPLGEFFVDTDNPFERPAAMEKMGQGYDNLVKEKCSYRIAPGSIIMEQGSASFGDFWNQFNPFLTLDSMMNMIVFPVPSNVSRGSQWDDSVQNENIKVKNSYAVLEDDGDALRIKCSGTNVFSTNPAFENSNAVVLKVQRLNSTYTGVLEVEKATGLVRKAEFDVVTANRKNVMGQKIDSERKETLKISNRFD